MKELLFLLLLLLRILRCEKKGANRTWRRNGRREIHANIGSNIVVLCSCSSTRDSRFVPWRGFIIAVITVLAIVSAIAALLLLHRGRSRAHFPASQRPTCPIPIAIPPSLRPPPLPPLPQLFSSCIFHALSNFPPPFRDIANPCSVFFQPLQGGIFFHTISRKSRTNSTIDFHDSRRGSEEHRLIINDGATTMTRTVKRSIIAFSTPRFSISNSNRMRAGYATVISASFPIKA